MSAFTVEGISPTDDPDAVANAWIAEVRRRYETDAPFHARVYAVRRALGLAYSNHPSLWQVALALHLDDRFRKEML